MWSSLQVNIRDKHTYTLTWFHLGRNGPAGGVPSGQIGGDRISVWDGGWLMCNLCCGDFWTSLCFILHGSHSPVETFLVPQKHAEKRHNFLKWDKMKTVNPNVCVMFIFYFSEAKKCFILFLDRSLSWGQWKNQKSPDRERFGITGLSHDQRHLQRGRQSTEGKH